MNWNYKKIKQGQSGQIALGTAVFFVIISSTIVLGMAASVVREVRIVKEFVGTRESYFLSEALNEDLTYRVKTARNIPVSPTLVLNGYTATGTVLTIGDGKEILTTGDRQDSFRRIRTVLAQNPSGISFNYGIQSGNGGFSLGNGAGVIGNVYANGDILGNNGSYITGSAVAANSIPLLADVINDSPTTPPNSIVFGNANGTQDVAQSFQMATSAPLNKIQLYIKKTSTPGNATVRVVTDSSGVPSNNVISSGTLTASSVTGTYSWIDVVLSPEIELTPGVTYWFVVDAGTNATRYYTIGANTTYASGVAKIGQYSPTWNNTTPSGLDIYFKVYVGGSTSIVSGVGVGTGSIGDVWAHSVTGSTVAGALYCQTGSGNNKACDTSRPDPTPIELPLRDEIIEEWKTEAGSATTTGNYSLTNGATGSLGPRVVTGNMTIDNNAVLTLTGTLYVKGNITLSNGARIQLSSSFGTNSGIVIADGKVSIGNGADFAGSGQAGSYIFLVSTSDCPTSSSCAGGNAITLANNAGGLIVNAQQGTVHVSNGAAAKEVTAYKVEFANNATVTYESGLANVHFSSGPTGGYDITGWQEVR